MIGLNQIGDKTPGDVATLDRPLDHLLACHRRIEERLESLERAAAHLDDRRDEACQAIENSFRFLDSSGVLHTADEEESIFPRFTGALTIEEKAFVEGLELQHQETEKVYGELKRFYLAWKDSAPSAPAAKDRFRSLVARLCDLYRSHIAAEDTQLVPIGRRVLDAEQLAAIATEMKARRGL